MSRVRGKVGCAMDQKKSKGSKDIQVLFTSLSVLGAGREQKEARITPSSILENDYQALGLFVGEEEGRKMREKKRKRRGERCGEGWEREMRVGLQVGENDSEALISHSVKEAIIKTSSSFEKRHKTRNLSLFLLLS